MGNRDFERESSRLIAEIEDLVSRLSKFEEDSFSEAIEKRIFRKPYYREFKGKGNPTHVLIDGEGYQQLAYILDGIRKRIPQAVAALNARIEEVRRLSAAEIDQIKHDQEAEIESLKARLSRQYREELDTYKQRYNSDIKTIENTYRIMRERHNKNLDLRPAKQHHGYLVANQHSYPLIDKDLSIICEIYSYTLITPYAKELRQSTIMERIYKDLGDIWGQYTSIRAPISRYAKAAHLSNDFTIYNVKLSANLHHDTWLISFDTTHELDLYGLGLTRPKPSEDNY